MKQDCFGTHCTLLTILALVTGLASTGIVAVVVNTGCTILTRPACFTWVCVREFKRKTNHLSVFKANPTTLHCIDSNFQRTVGIWGFADWDHERQNIHRRYFYYAIVTWIPSYQN